MQPAENKRRGIKVISVVAIIFLTIYLLSFYYWVNSKSISTGIIRMDTIEDYINTEGVLVRDEEVLKAPIDGECIIEAAEGDKIPSSFTVATILRGDSKAIRDQIKEIDLRIINAVKENEDNNDLFSDDALKIESEIARKVNVIISQSNKNSLAEYPRLHDEIDALLMRKASIIGEKSPAGAFIADLKRQKTTLQDKLQQHTKEIVSQGSGIISYYVDGYEGTLSPKSIKELTPKVLDDIKPTDKRVIADKSIKIESGKPLAKIISGIDSYIVAVVDADKAGAYKDDQKLNIRINDISRIVDGIVSYKSESISGKCVVAVKIDKCLSETAGSRRLNIDLIRTSYKGLKVPLSSLRDINKENMTAKITLNKANYASIRDIKIVGYNEEYAIIDSIIGQTDKGVSLYDIFVLNPENIQEGQMITQ